VLAMLFVVQEKRQRWDAFIAAIIVMVVCILPVYEHIAHIAKWLSNLVLRNGSYGTGDLGIISVNDIIQNIHNVFYHIPIVCVGVVCSLAALSLGYKDRVSLAIFSVFAMQFALIIKPMQVHYFIAVIPISSLSIAWFLFRIRKRTNLNGCPAMIVVAVGCFWSYSGLEKLSSIRRALNAEVKELNAVISNYHDAIVIGYYGVPDQSYAINFALSYTPRTLQLRAVGQIPSQISYHLGGYFFDAADGPVELERTDLYRETKRPILLLFPREIDLERFRCEQPVWSGPRFHVCHLLRT
jgi:hypothetical protein